MHVKTITLNNFINGDYGPEHTFKQITQDTTPVNCILSHDMQSGMSDQFDYLYLQGVLESNLCSFYFHLADYCGKRSKKGIPIKNLSLDKQQPISTVVNYIKFLQRNDFVFPDKNQNDLALRCFKNLLNACVYEVYFEEEITLSNTNVLSLLSEFLESRKALPINDQIVQLFQELGEYKSEIRNRIILQETRSAAVGQVLRYLQRCG
jgi:hypothetical protein